MVAKAVFWVALAGLAYPYLLYPLILVAVRWAGRSRQWTVDSGHRPPSTVNRLPMVSLIVPVHNEEAVLHAKLRNSLLLDYPADRLELLVACDGCTDSSVRIAMAYSYAGVRVISSDVRRGKIFAMNLAARHAEGSILLFTDARAVLGTDSVRRIVARFDRPDVGVVSGAICAEQAGDRRMGPTLKAYRWLENHIRSLEADIHSTIGATGALYAVRASLYPEIPEDTILDDLVVPLRLLRRGFRAVFDMDATCSLSAAGSTEFARKRRTLAGNYQALWRERAALNPLSSRVAWQLLSHKAARLAAPLLLVVVWIASCLAEGTVYSAALAGQCAFYGTALLGLGLSRARGRLARLQVPYSVCVLQAANLCGLLAFSLGRMDVRWKKSE